MNCLEFRRAVGADPQHLSDAMREHRTQCSACDGYAREMSHLDGLIKRALQVAVPSIREVKSAPSRTRWYAMAASVLLAIGVGALWLLAYPRDSLANDLVTHLNHEREAMQPNATRVSTQLLDGALRAKGLHLAKSIDDVSYLRTCIIRRHFVPHLVVQTAQGPVTVLLLLDEHVATSQRFDEQQYHGVVLPTPRGAMAVIALDQSLASSIADKVNQSIVWK